MDVCGVEVAVPVRGPSQFNDREMLAAQCLHLALRAGHAAEDTTCVPFVVADMQVEGPGGPAYQLDDGRIVSFGPAQSSYVADAAAHVVPHELAREALAVGFVLYLQVGAATVRALGPVDAGGEALVAKLTPRRLAVTLRPGSGEGVVGAFLGCDGGDAFVISPVDEPRRAVSALDDVGWGAPDVLPPIVARLRGRPFPLPPELVVPTGTLYVQGWLERLVQAAERHGPADARTVRVADRPPATTTLERMTAQKLVTSAADGRLPSRFDTDTLRWGGADLATMLLAGSYGSAAQQLERLAAVDGGLAAKASRACERLGVDAGP